MPITVTALAVTPVKGMRVTEVDTVELGDRGALGNRVFYIIDERGRMVNGKNLKYLQTVVADYDPSAQALTLVFADGTKACGEVAYDGTVTTSFFNRPREARVVRGPFNDALSGFFEQPLRLVADGGAVDRGRRGAISMMSRASLHHLASVAERDGVDGRRFRMLIEVDGIKAYEEDGWLGRGVRVGSALVRPCGHVGRCVITTRDPETGADDLDTLKLLATYRHKIGTTEPLAFGIFGEVLEGGAVRVGDAVTVEGR
ncbi:MAG: MOSC N-terminal beta barrel domain-containing protein [Solirubrobacteraceae bacterium]